MSSTKRADCIRALLDAELHGRDGFLPREKVEGLMDVLWSWAQQLALADMLEKLAEMERRGQQ